MPQSAGSLTVIPIPGLGAEDVVVGTHGPDEGAVFTGTEDGAIWRVSPDGAKVDRVAETGGRPLGIEIDLDGRLLVCDAHRGLLRVDTRSGAVEAVADSVAGVRMVVCNNAAIATDGTVWFSDSSKVHRLERWRRDIVEATCTGRLMRHDPDGTTTVVLEGLDYANGVALAADESYVAVAESGACTVVRQWLTGAKAGTRDYLVPELPGYPDNIARGSDGLIWVTIASPPNGWPSGSASVPIGSAAPPAKVPTNLQPQPKPCVRVQAYDDAGTLVHDLDLPADRLRLRHRRPGARRPGLAGLPAAAGDRVRRPTP